MRVSARSGLVALVFGLAIAAAPAVQARELPEAKPARVGMSAERLQRLTDHMNQAVADGVMVGGLGLVARDGKVVYQQTYGLADREPERPMTEDTIFRIYSMSKPITAVAVLMLYEEGHFFLNDPVARYIPELADLEVAVSTADGGNTRMVSDGTVSRTEGSGDASQAGKTRAPRRQPTIRDLLTHTAGFTYGVFGNTEVDRMYREAGLLADDATLEDFVTRLGGIPLQYDPGTRWHYSVAVDVQGRLVEAVSGMKFGDFLEQRIFAPLGMVDTSFVVPDDKWDRVAELYSPAGTPEDTAAAFQSASTATELVEANKALDEGYRPGARFESGGGGLMSTASDYLRFSQMLLNGGELDGVRLLSPKTVELMTVNHLGDIPMGFGRDGVGFGLGVAVALDQGEIGELGSPGEYNWGGAAGTRFWVDPEEDLVGIFMVQSIPHRTRLGSEFKNLVYQAIVE
ncbi:MAG: serine hydrolase [Gammaproteobacteria bacterium]|nr:serine hydrolase [Gammaproteobacteria bacterium]